MKKTVQMIVIDTDPDHTTFKTYPKGQLEKRYDDQEWLREGDTIRPLNDDGKRLKVAPRELQPTDAYLTLFEEV